MLVRSLGRPTHILSLCRHAAISIILRTNYNNVTHICSRKPSTPNEMRKSGHARRTYVNVVVDAG